MLNKKPWPHIVIDNFLEENLYEKITKDVINSWHYDSTPSNTKILSGVLFDTDGNIIEDKTLSKVLDFDTIVTLFEDYYPKCIEILKQLAPEKVERVKHFDVQVTVCGENYTTEKIHVDAPQKMLSLVVYLYPEKSYGTILFTSKEEDGIITEWRQNRAMVFSRETNTWHTYKSGNQKRVTLMLNLNSGFIE